MIYPALLMVVMVVFLFYLITNHGFDLFSQMNLKPHYLPLRAYEYEQYDFRREQEGELSG